VVTSMADAGVVSTSIGENYDDEAGM